MALLEALTLNLAPALSKAVLKLWLPDHPLAEAAGESILDMAQGRVQDFATAYAVERLFHNLAPDVAKRLRAMIDVEFAALPDGDRCAAVDAVARLLKGLALSRAMMQANLNAVGLEEIARPGAAQAFAGLGVDAAELANILLRECCGYAVAMAVKLPDFQVAATRELLERTHELQADLARVLESIDAMRQAKGDDAASNNFETQYRRVIAQRLDRMQLFGLRLVGAGARELEISVAYVTLSSSNSKSGEARDVDSALAGLTRAVVQGEAGFGKTTLLQWLAIRAANRDFAGPLAGWNGFVPVYLSLRDYADGAFPAPEAMVSRVSSNLAGIMPAGWMHGVLARGALVLIDGLDEVAIARRPLLLEWLRGLVNDFSKSVFVLSSRPAALQAVIAGGATGQRLNQLGFEQVRLEPMGLADSEALISQWHQAVSRDISDQAQLESLEKYERALIRALRDRPAIRNLASNPLLCAMICVLNWDRKQVLPDNRMELYREALHMLIYGREVERGIVAARLSELDQQEKEALLDGLAYWMMRNNMIEAEKRDVVEQIRLLLQRLSKISSHPADVLQELLERTGVLRQPQHELVDFVHRTFLEFMAARAAIAAGDLGMLADKARDDGWREMIVFAAGHARGRQRDDFIRKLLPPTFFPRLGRATEVDVTTVCCLETVSANLDPELLRRLQKTAEQLFPPQSVELARVLAPAARLNPALLRGHAAQGEAVVAACIRCAALAGGTEMLEVIGGYAACPGEQIWHELVDAWLGFETDAYLERVIKRRSSLDFAELDVRNLSEEAVACLQLLVLKGASNKSAKDLAAALKIFVNERALNFTDWAAAPEGGGGNLLPGSAAAKRVTELDAARLAHLRSLRRLKLGATEPGVLAAIAELPELEHLDCSPVYPAELKALAGCARLKNLTLDGFSVPYRSRKTEELDLRALNGCKDLAVLEVRGFKERPAIYLPQELALEELRLAYVPPQALVQLKAYSGLRKLQLQFDVLPGSSLDLSGLPRLEDAVLHFEASFKLALPGSLAKLHITRGETVAFIGGERLSNLQTLTFSSVRDVEGVGPMLRQPKLWYVSLNKRLAAKFEAEISRLRAAGRDIVMVNEN